MTDQQPVIAKRTRDIVYIAGLVVTAATGLATGTVGVLFPDLRAQATEIATIVLTNTGIIVAGLGVVYRPGAQQL